MEFIDSIIEKAKKNIKTIILPEATDIRVLSAALKLQKDKIANIILIGNPEEVKKIANENSINISEIDIIDSKTSEKLEDYSETLYQLRKEKGLEKNKADELVKDNVYFGMMMLYKGEADGLVSGAIHSTSDTLRPALQILKTAPGTKLVSSFFIMDVPGTKYKNTYIFSDCGLNEYPNSEQLSEIALSSAKSYEHLVGKTASIGMLSYSTYGSAKSEYIDKVIEATKLTKMKNPQLNIDGELQLDAAIDSTIAELKAPGSKNAGTCNTLIFPNLDAGNIGYKLVQRFGNAKAYGPLCQGIAKPVNDLSRGCISEDIIGVVAITAVQAQENN